MPLEIIFIIIGLIVVIAVLLCRARLKEMIAERNGILLQSPATSIAHVVTVFHALGPAIFF